ncbi:hypothetical protein GFK91_29780 (plasmid) [Roseibium aggregatum]|uniref:hypothetical protein n=1 Tax=Roseibium aggregatum TaxID=187304 RepID=UPI001E4524B7|nr:hypothetical protein [Roseibium aggregatum]UES59937.1 hypothetical protein GFK91_29780 [Roseibium aggregatum]
MPLNRQQFGRDINAVVDVYRADNAWVNGWARWDQRNHMDHYIDAAFRLYDATARNQLGMTLLGGTGIRTCKELISNFGITAANGIQDQQTVWIAQQEEYRRRRGRGEGQGDGNGPVARNPVAVQGVGSILSEKDWTPILNDALIIGAATGHQTFHIALEAKEGPIWRQCEEEAREWQALNQGIRIDYPTWAWQEFMNRNIGMLWDQNYNVPRVLARELIGLCFAGYRPVFRYQELFFMPNPAAPDPTFREYAVGLRQLGFHTNLQRANVMRHISEFLFDNRRAVCVPGDEYI